MFCKEVFRVEHKSCCQSGKHYLEIVVWSCSALLNYSLTHFQRYFYLRHLWRDPLASTGEPLIYANISVPCRHQAKSISTRLIYCWSLLSVPLLRYHFTLSLPLLSATTSDSLGNASIKRCGREVRQSEGIRTSAWWCVNSPSESLMLRGEEGLPGSWHEREPSLHKVLIANWSAGLSAPFFGWAVGWKRPWEKQSQH